MSFKKTNEEILANTKETADFYNAEMLTLFWETSPEIVKRLLPPPLEMAKFPVAIAFIANYSATNFGVAYRETALFLRASYKGTEGSYCLSMPVTNDMAMAAGREIFGFPKKMADISFKKNGDLISGWTERHGIRFMEIQANMTGNINNEKDLELMTSGNMQADGSIQAVSYNFKHFPNPERSSFDYTPRLVKQVTLLRPRELKLGTGEIKFKTSGLDPWDEVKVVRILGAVYMIGDNSMLSGEVIAEADPIEFAPYSFLKWDFE